MYLELKMGLVDLLNLSINEQVACHRRDYERNPKQVGNVSRIVLSLSFKPLAQSHPFFHCAATFYSFSFDDSLMSELQFTD